MIFPRQGKWGRFSFFSPYTMGQVWSTIESMMGPDVDERDVRLAVRMVRAHHAAIVQARDYGVPVPWGQTSHINPIFVLNPVRTEWDYIGQMFENAPLETYQALHEDGILAMLDDLQNFQSDPESEYPFGAFYVGRCSVCDAIAHDGDADLWDGPIGTERFFARYGNREMPGGYRTGNHYGFNTGIGRNRRVEGDNM